MELGGTCYQEDKGRPSNKGKGKDIMLQAKSATVYLY